MKNYRNISVLLVYFLTINSHFSQNVTISRQVIGSYGSSHQLTNSLIMDNLGEIAVTTLSSPSGKTLTQGFEQPNYVMQIPEVPFEANNVFSPDEDGTNDTWILPITGDYSNNVVTIFNRWGDQIASFENYNNIDVVWNGKYASGVNVPAGTYFYTVELLDYGTTKSGWVQIVR